MVSRFPNGSPIQYDGQTHIVATFNREFTREELLNKLTLVNFFSGPGPATYHTDSTQPEDTSTVKMSANLMASIDLHIDGTNLTVSYENSLGWLFDIDFDGQNRKFFEKTSAVYLMQLPNIIATSSTPKYAIAQVTNRIDGLRSKTLTVNLAINDTTDYQPIAADAELTDIDVNDWFYDGSGSTDFARISELVKQILQVEYFLPESVTINVGNATSAEWTVDGGLWNLFTDGSVYVPLMLTSRLEGGSPLFVNENSDDPAIRAPKRVCTFNRPTTPQELALHDFKAVITDFFDEYAQIAPFVRYSESQICFGDEEEGGAWVELQNNGTELWVTYAGKIWSVDLDNQYQRPLTLPSSVTPLMFECANPNLLDVGQGVKLDLFMFNNMGAPAIMVVTNDDGTMVKGSSGQLPPQNYQSETSNVLALLNDILEMEFSNWEDFTTNTEIYTNEPISGTVDLLTVSSVTPA